MTSASIVGTMCTAAGNTYTATPCGELEESQKVEPHLKDTSYSEYCIGPDYDGYRKRRMFVAITSGMVIGAGVGAGLGAIAGGVGAPIGAGAGAIVGGIAGYVGMDRSEYKAWKAKQTIENIRNVSAILRTYASKEEEDLFCPITQEIMREPFNAAPLNICYEGEAIREHLRKQAASRTPQTFPNPHNNVRLDPTLLQICVTRVGKIGNYLQFMAKELGPHSKLFAEAIEAMQKDNIKVKRAVELVFARELQAGTKNGTDCIRYGYACTGQSPPADTAAALPSFVVNADRRQKLTTAIAAACVNSSHPYRILAITEGQTKHGYRRIPQSFSEQRTAASNASADVLSLSLAMGAAGANGQQTTIERQSLLNDSVLRRSRVGPAADIEAMLAKARASGQMTVSRSATEGDIDEWRQQK